VVYSKPGKAADISGRLRVAVDVLGAVAAITRTRPLSATPWRDGKLLNMALTWPEARSLTAPELPL
jgi:hypothetical protein